MRGRWAASLVVFAFVGFGMSGAQGAGERSVTYVGVTRDTTDFRAAGIGRAGSWLPYAGATRPANDRPTGEREYDALPKWIAPLNHVASITGNGCELADMWSTCLPTYAFRSFSQDGPARAAGGRATWNTFTLPHGRTIRSGAIVDPYTRGNVNNTVNRLQLRGAVPSSFLVHVITDNTNRAFDATGRLMARGNNGPLDADLQIDPETFPRNLVNNGVADVYTFRFDNFVNGDYVKIRLEGDANGAGASFGGVLFDLS